MNFWLHPVSGDWSDGTKWSDGVPGPGEDLQVSFDGAYTVTLSTAGAAKSLRFDAPGATFVETAAGSLTLTGDLTLASNAVLGGDNNIAFAVIEAGTTTIQSADALGSQYLELQSGPVHRGGVILADRDLEVSFQRLFIFGGAFAAAGGATLTVASPETVVFESRHTTLTIGDGVADGTVIIADAADYQGRNLDRLTIASGTLMGGAGQDETAALARTVEVKAGAAFDFNGHDLSIHVLQGGGSLLDGGDPVAATLHGGHFRGSIANNIDLDIAGRVTLGSTGYVGNVTLEAGATLQLAGHASEHVIMGADGVLLKVARPFNFQGIISNFGGSDSIDLHGAAYDAWNPIEYIDNGGSGTLTIHEGANEINIHFDGSYHLDNFHLASDGVGGTLLSFVV